jgi:GrpB-like predicted nucleotidyltransferase (UPF0157 family)
VSNYVHEGDLGIGGREAFRWRPGEPRHHAVLKRSLAKAYEEDRGAYIKAKGAFIASVIDITPSRHSD